MKIYIKLDNGKSYKIPAPLTLLQGLLGMGNFGVFIAKRFVPEEQQQYIDCVNLSELSKSLNVLRAYKGLKIVDVKASDGTEVRITI